MQLNTSENQAIALAGIAQASYLVQQLATHGTSDQDAFEASLGSILKIDADSVADVYGGLSGVKTGLEQLEKQLSNSQVHNPVAARYSASIVFLEKQLSGKPEMLKTIKTGIEKAQLQAEHFGPMHENIIANLGDLYHETISTLQPRIMVNGEQNYLSNRDIVNKVRSVLLSGIRSALLWRQCGGSRWKFLFFRRRLLDDTRKLLATI